MSDSLYSLTINRKTTWHG